MKELSNIEGEKMYKPKNIYVSFMVNCEDKDIRVQAFISRFNASLSRFIGDLPRFIGGMYYFYSLNQYIISFLFIFNRRLNGTKIPHYYNYSLR